MVFEYILKKHNLDPATDLHIDQSIDFRLHRRSILRRAGGLYRGV